MLDARAKGAGHWMMERALDDEGEESAGALDRGEASTGALDEGERAMGHLLSARVLKEGGGER